MNWAHHIARPNSIMKRIYSIDAFRGFDMLFLVGLSSVIASICILFPDGEHSWLYDQMDHARWHGLNMYDLVFPTFLFIAGLSWPFSYENKVSKGLSNKQIYRDIAKRVAVLFLLGLVYNRILLNWNLAELRYYHVLFRIGFCWAIACILYMNAGRRKREIIAVALLLGYYLLLRFVPVPGAEDPDPFSYKGNLPGYIDRCIRYNDSYHEFFDPEGLLSNIPAIVTAMLGVFTGELIHDTGVSEKGKVLRMGVTAFGLIGLGLLWSIWFPINKSLWTSSFVLVAGGIAIALFGLFYYIIDIRGHKKWAFPFKVVGMNSITIYIAMEIIPFRTITDNIFGGIYDLCPPQWQPLIYSVGYTLICWLFLYFLYKKKVFLKV